VTRALTAKHKAAPAAGRWRKAQSASGNATSVCVTSASCQLSVRTAFTGDRGAGTGKGSGIRTSTRCVARSWSATTERSGTVNEDSERVEKRAEAYRNIQAAVFLRAQEHGLEQELLALGKPIDVSAGLSMLRQRGIDVRDIEIMFRDPEIS
jgi:hypothetical protein